jgi:hypothetical protein
MAAGPRWLPHRTFIVGLVKRALFLWVGIKAIVTLFLASTGGKATVRTAIVIVLLVGFLSLLDARRRNEHIFWANLGVAPWTLAALASIPAVAGECIVAWISRT